MVPRTTWGRDKSAAIHRTCHRLPGSGGRCVEQKRQDQRLFFLGGGARLERGEARNGRIIYLGEEPGRTKCSIGNSLSPMVATPRLLPSAPQSNAATGYRSLHICRARNSAVSQ